MLPVENYPAINMQTKNSTEQVKHLVRETPQLSEATRQVYLERLNTPVKSTPQFFDEARFRILIAVSERLIFQDGLEDAVDLAGLLDTSLCAGEGDGWRYDEMPDDKTVLQKGLELVDLSAFEDYAKAFVELEPEQKDELLTRIQSGDIQWKELNAPRFFEELLARLTEIFYSHPLARMSINDLSGFDLPGWTNIGLNQTGPEKR